jgi:NCS1 family nucleobase:cation symporter-1
MIADYYVWRGKKLEAAQLYQRNGVYRYTGGFSIVGFGVLLASVLPNLPGFLVTIKALPAEAFPGWLVASYHYAWFVGFALAFFLYSLIRPLFPNR